MQQAIARQIQLQDWDEVPFIPLGQSFIPTAHRANIHCGDADLVLFWCA